MPLNVPTSAAAIKPPRISGGSVIELIVTMTPSTAATIPRAGVASAKVAIAPETCACSW